MPKDVDFNLDNPDGITNDDMQRMREEEAELKKLAESAEANAEKIAAAKLKMEGMSFMEKNILDKTLSSETLATEGYLSKEEMAQMIIDATKEIKETKKEISEAKKERKEIKAQIKQAEKDRRDLENSIKGEISGAGNKFNQVLGASGNPIGFARGRLMSIAGRAGIAGAIITVVYGAVQTLWDQYIKSFEDGGANDIRKKMEDRDKEMMELNDILARRSGRVFFTGDVDLKQGAPQFSNTERLRDQVLRYQALHLGE